MMRFKKLIIFFLCILSYYFEKNKFSKILQNLLSDFRFSDFETSDTYVLPNLGLAYVLNAKVACSSIKLSLARANGFNAKISDYQEIHVHPTINDLRAKEHSVLDESYYVFTYVRDPYKRLLSAWLNKFQSPYVNDNNFLYKNYYGGIFSRNDSFLAFVLKVLMIPDKFSDRHFVSQSYWLFEKNKYKIDFFDKIENISFSYPKLAAKFGLPPLEHFNKSLEYSLDDYYNPLIYFLVNKRYSHDFDMFGYKKRI